MAELDMYQMIPADPGPLTAAFAQAFSRKRMKDKKSSSQSAASHRTAPSSCNI
ncbi:hypothetical protein QKW52_16405 [Bacillus sonorensis]|nr:hypothetical protein [Bacillus sonorensis]